MIVKIGTVIGKNEYGIYLNGLICKVPEIKTPLTLHGMIELTAAPASFNTRVK